ncbi:MAG: NYN domain-containing protein [Spirochaetia bacterium]|nr:NYN domain-containing protein [Spirochaetia bacterium]
MIILVDAFNVLYKFPELEEHMAHGRLIEARLGLLRILSEFQVKWKKPIRFHLFFDGKKNKGDLTEKETIAGMEVYFSHDLSADYMIKQAIKSHPRPADLRIVSSDKQVLGSAKKWKCELQTSEEFQKWVDGILNAEPPQPEKEDNVKLSPGDVRYWLGQFRRKQP